MYFLPPAHFSRTMTTQSSPPPDTNNSPWLIYQGPTPTNSNHELCSLSNDPRKPELARTARKGAKYDALPETTQIDIADGYVTFCRTFKFLGSKILYNLCGNDDIEVRLSATNKSMGALEEV